MMERLLEVGAVWFIYHLFEYGFHRLGHWKSPWNYIHTLHNKHHKDYYPVTRLQSDQYEGQYEGLVAYIPLGCLTAYGMSWIVSRESMIWMIYEFIFLAVINDYLHGQYHRKNAWLSRFNWFQRQQKLHFNHHKNVETNFAFGGLTYIFDKMFGTYKPIQIQG
jgi:sterol desaturase/sphingolipid hydroxylase (fatty acid hydroxylase superfamily)